MRHKAFLERGHTQVDCVGRTPQGKNRVGGRINFRPFAACESRHKGRIHKVDQEVDCDVAMTGTDVNLGQLNACTCGTVLHYAKGRKIEKPASVYFLTFPYKRVYI